MLCYHTVKRQELVTFFFFLLSQDEAGSREPEHFFSFVLLVSNDSKPNQSEIWQSMVFWA